MAIAFLVAMAMNFYAYYYSSEQVLAQYNAIPVDRSSSQNIQYCRETSCESKSPYTKIYIYS